jgi:hypothetical protein
MSPLHVLLDPIGIRLPGLCAPHVTIIFLEIGGQGEGACHRDGIHFFRPALE